MRCAAIPITQALVTSRPNVQALNCAEHSHPRHAARRAAASTLADLSQPDPAATALPPATTALLHSAARFAALRSLDLRGACAAPLLRGPLPTSLTSLDLRGCGLSAEDFHSLTDVHLPRLRGLRRLELHGNVCQTHEAAQLVAFVSSASALRTLSMPDALRAPDVREGGSLLTFLFWVGRARLAQLRGISITCDELYRGTDGLWAFAGPCIASPAELKDLCLQNVRRACLSALVVRSLCTAVRLMPKLRALTLAAVPAGGALARVAAAVCAHRWVHNPENDLACLSEAVRALDGIEELALCSALVQQRQHQAAALQVAAALPRLTRLQLGGDTSPEVHCAEEKAAEARHDAARTSTCVGALVVGADIRIYAWPAVLRGVTSLEVHAAQPGQAWGDEEELQNAQNGILPPLTHVGAAGAPNWSCVPAWMLPQLRTLRVGCADVAAAGVSRRGAALRALTALRTLDMSARDAAAATRDQVAWVVARVVAHLGAYPHLCAWDLSGNAVSDASACTIGGAHRDPAHAALTVALRNTAVTPRGAFELARREAWHGAARQAPPRVTLQF